MTENESWEMVNKMGSYISSWARFTAKGAKVGYQYTKKAVRSMGVGKLVPLGGRQLASKVNLRKLFRVKHRKELGEAAALQLSDDESSSSEEEIGEGGDAEDALYQRVEKKYFDPSFNATKEELEQTVATYMEDPVQVEIEIKRIEERGAARQVPLNVIRKTLKRRLLRNYAVFLQGVSEVSAVNHDLKNTAINCHRGRLLLGQAKETAVKTGLAIPMLNRRRQNLRELECILSVLEDVRERHETFVMLLRTGHFQQAIRMTQSHIDGEEILDGIDVAREYLDYWHNFTTDPGYVLTFIDAAIDECVTGRFAIEKYENAVEGYLLLNDHETATNKVVMTLWRAAEDLILKSVVGLTSVQSTALSVAVKGLHPDTLIPCVCHIGARTLDFLVLYSAVSTSHGTFLERGCQNKDTEQFHKEVLKLLGSVGKRIALTFHNQLAELLQGFPLHNVDVDKVLHIFFVLMLLAESTSLLGASAEDMSNVRVTIKHSVTGYLSQFYQSGRCSVQVVNRMLDELWISDPDISPVMFKTIKPLSPVAYRRDVKWVKSYVSKHGTVGAEIDNPFLSEYLMIPHDVTNTLEVIPFSCDPKRCVTTGAAAIVANHIFEYLVRVAVRFPPLAHEVLLWSHELVALYFYINAANFVSVSRSTPLEDQSDFSPLGKRLLKQLRDMALRCAPHLNRVVDGIYQFPPAVFGCIQAKYASKEYNYALGERIVSIESVIPLVGLLEKALDSVAPLLIPSIQEQQKEFLDQLRFCVEDVLRVGLYRLSSAVFDIEWCVEDITKTKFDGRQEMQPSKYVWQLANSIKQFVSNFDVSLPNPYTRRHFWSYFFFSVQRSLIRGYAKVKKVSDSAVTQMMVDEQALFQELNSLITSLQCHVNEDYLRGLLKVYFLGPDERMQWMRSHHQFYTKTELMYWLASGDKEKRHVINDLLVEWRHEDQVPHLP